MAACVTKKRLFFFLGGKKTKLSGSTKRSGRPWEIAILRDCGGLLNGAFVPSFLRFFFSVLEAVFRKRLEAHAPTSNRCLAMSPTLQMLGLFS